MADLKGTPATELEGGFIHIRAKVYRGVIRRRDDHRIAWQCKHNHYRPEYNARYTQDTKKVWETSGLNCGRAAYAQLLEGKRVVGDPGLVGDPKFPIALRDDVRFAKVGDEEFLGRVTLHSSGHRILRVSHAATTVAGDVNLDLPPSKAVSTNFTSAELLPHWATAAWLLKGAVWGVVFQDPRVRMHVDKPLDRAIEEMLEIDGTPGPKKLVKSNSGGLVLPETYDRPTPGVGKKKGSGKGRTASRKSRKTPPSSSTKKLPSTEPHIRVARDEKGKRVFEVVGFNDDVVDRFIHRGRANDRLAKVKERKP